MALAPYFSHVNRSRGDGLRPIVGMEALGVAGRACLRPRGAHAFCQSRFGLSPGRREPVQGGRVPTVALEFSIPHFFRLMQTPSPFAKRARARNLLIAFGAAWVGSALLAAPPSRVRQASAHTWIKLYAAEPLATDGLRAAEKAFLAKAIETARQQMRLAEVGASQADSSEVRSHALQLASDYRELSDALEALVRRKGGLAGAPAGATSETYQKLSEKSGADFDREFVRIVAVASGQVMTLFETAAAEAKDQDVRDFAANELPILRAHRNTIADLKKTYD